MVMRIALIARPGQEDSGIGRYTRELKAALEQAGHTVILAHPLVPIPGLLARAVRNLLGWDLVAFFNTYPVWVRYPQADIYHFTGQNLATVLLWRSPPGRTVVTVHDIIPWLLRADPELQVYEHRFAAWFDRLALAGLRRADGLIADSTFTRASLRQAGLFPGAD
jgi:hypothetical protein